MKSSSYRFSSLDDLSHPKDGLPPTDGIRLWFAREGSDERIRIIIRPSGTEPKLKCYIEVVGDLVMIDEVESIANESARVITDFLNDSL